MNTQSEPGKREILIQMRLLAVSIGGFTTFGMFKIEFTCERPGRSEIKCYGENSFISLVLAIRSTWGYASYNPGMQAQKSQGIPVPLN